ncbi:MAG: glycerol-3-phosphate 1-O-acyltransferase [Kangiellaceae bacterium]|jgi:glycerol-3-phosphate O-acyltransferase|nr:glycerol-3-phosphate 1-O-acyltransferase [Kangiellaceae bacterium]|tara:strand:+ start:7943 stop:10372 length:2430 start_codon:yes stop_codon:yes gene_type:complete
MAPWLSLRFGLAKLLIGWATKRYIVPKQPLEQLDIDTSKPICYVLRTRSYSALATLEIAAKENKLPFNANREASETPNYLFLGKPHNWLSLNGELPEEEEQLTNCLNAVKDGQVPDVQIVPVAIYWGRNPGKERSLFKLLFADQENIGALRRLLVVLANGRHTFVRFSRPISLKQWLDGVEQAQDQRKLVRTLKHHFHYQRQAAFGPGGVNTNEIARQILSTDAVKQAISAEAKKKKISQGKAKHKAKKMVLEIASTPSFAVLRFFSLFLSWLWNKLYDGVECFQTERLREVAKENQVIYVPCHRSHMDYLLLSYVLYHEGLMPPYIAAGINLDFWPIGSVLRRSGAFFIRRSFRNDRLYQAVFSEYMNCLAKRGLAIEYFIEGGRSRTGKLLSPKTGMISMTLSNYIQDKKKPIVFVPVYIGYDRVMEVSTYHKELFGKEKKKESMFQLLRSRRALSQSFGKVNVNFGEPLFLDEQLDTLAEGWRENKDERPSWLKPVVSTLSLRLCESINAAAAPSTVSLVSSILLTTPRLSIDEKRMSRLLSGLLNMLETVPYSQDLVYGAMSAPQHIEKAIEVNLIERQELEGGNILRLANITPSLLTYYSNNILHLFALPSLIASHFVRNTTVAAPALRENMRKLYPFVKRELFLPHNEHQAETYTDELLAWYEKTGWLKHDEGHFSCTDQHTAMLVKHMAGFSEALLSAWAIPLCILVFSKDPGSRGQVISLAAKIAKQLEILYGFSSPDKFDKSMFQQFIDVYLTDHEQQDVDSAAALLDLLFSLLPQAIENQLMEVAMDSIGPANQELVVS